VLRFVGMRRPLIAALYLVVASRAQAQTPEPAAPPPAPESPPPATAPPPPEGTPPPEYYVEPAGSAPRVAEPEPAPAAAPAPGPQVYEPPPPGFGPVHEPPPPPVPRHIAPKTAFWLGARLGWFVPFGNVFAQGTPAGEYIVLDGVPWSDYASSGPMFEIDVGMRLARSYNLFALWERAQLGSGDALNDVSGGQSGGDTDFFAVGLRASSDPDHVGFVTELALGYRRARATWEDGTELQFTGGVLEGRIGLGADIRLSPVVTLSPLLTLGVGSFGDVEWQAPNGYKTDAFGPDDQADGHAWFTLTMGGHFDLAGSK
jgi:hypothetical protein